MLDGDQSYTQGIPYTKVDETGVSATYMVAYPGNIQEDAFAWMVFAPSQTTPNVEELYTSGQFTPHSGKQYLMAATATDPATTSTTSDDWLISPLLSGEAQKLHSMQQVRRHGAKISRYMCRPIATTLKILSCSIAT